MCSAFVWHRLREREIEGEREREREKERERERERDAMGIDKAASKVFFVFVFLSRPGSTFL